MPPSKGPKKGSKKKRPLTPKIQTEEEKPEEEKTGITSHKHCLNCGVSISPERETCSPKCQEEWDRMMKKKKFWNYLPFLGAAFLLALYIILSMAG